VQERLFQRRRLHGWLLKYVFSGCYTLSNTMRQKEGLVGKKAAPVPTMLQFRDGAAADDFLATLQKLLAA
jgi:hypothetical protein